MFSKNSETTPCYLGLWRDIWAVSAGKLRSSIVYLDQNLAMPSAQSSVRRIAMMLRRILSQSAVSPSRVHRSRGQTTNECLHQSWSTNLGVVIREVLIGRVAPFSIRRKDPIMKHGSCLLCWSDRELYASSVFSLGNSFFRSRFLLVRLRWCVPNLGGVVLFFVGHFNYLAPRGSDTVFI